MKTIFFGENDYGVTFDYDLITNTGLEIDVNGGESIFIDDTEIKQLIGFLQQLPLKYAN